MAYVGVIVCQSVLFFTIHHKVFLIFFSAYDFLCVLTSKISTEAIPNQVEKKIKSHVYCSKQQQYSSFMAELQQS